MSNADCPVARLGSETQTIVDGIERLQHAQADAEDANRAFLQSRERLLGDQLEVTEALMSYRVATSLDGVLLQVSQLMSSLGVIASYLDDEVAERLKGMIGRADLLAWAAIHGLERHGADRDRVNGGYYCGRGNDPFDDRERAA